LRRRGAGEHNITVNGYAPGVVVTPLWEQLDKDLVEIGFKEPKARPTRTSSATRCRSSACPTPTTSPAPRRSCQRRQRLHDRPDDPHRRRLVHPVTVRGRFPKPKPSHWGRALAGPQGWRPHVTRPDAQPAEPGRTSTRTGEWARHLPAWGHTSVDFERRVDHDRLRRYRLARTRQGAEEIECGALLLFDVNNIRYVSAPRSANGSATRCAASAC
jgi:hypothetical protein